MIGHEYPGPISKLLAYGLASFVSYSRIRSEQHFPADVFVGGIIGNLVSQEVFNRHHDPELPAATGDRLASCSATAASCRKIKARRMSRWTVGFTRLSTA